MLAKASATTRFLKPTDNDGLAISAILELGAISPSSLPLLHLQTTAYQRQVATPSSPTLVSATIQVCPVLKSPSTELAQSFAMIKLLLPKVAHGLAISVTQVLDATSPSPNHKRQYLKAQSFRLCFSLNICRINSCARFSFGLRRWKKTVTPK